jgi:hypothetical protein
MAGENDDDTPGDETEAFLDQGDEDSDEELDDEDEEDAAESAQAAESIELVILPIACTNEGKGAPLAMGVQR